MREAFSEIVDYAGLFPPATCTMGTAVRNYADYRASADRWMLGRFVVAASRLQEFGEAMASEGVQPLRTDPWRLSVVLGANVPDEVARITTFRQNWPALDVLVDAIECKASSPGQIHTLAEQIPPSLLRHFEVPMVGPYTPLVAAIAEIGSRAKVRTGGTSSELFPDAEQLTLFLITTVRLKVPFKATAGLHHPVRGVHPLTYEPEAPSHAMYGFINLLLATAELVRGGEGETAQEILEDDDSSEIRWNASTIQWRDLEFDRELLGLTRARFFQAFGSCSFREPVDELHLETTA